MKKSIKRLKLNKKSISNINVSGGAAVPRTNLCTVVETYWGICNLRKTKLTCTCLP
ncbi:hypothetical protein [Kordia sp.]|uniref:hypothetical protein n=1 Tax=Kordia sp. TaxID=1965332 RepID=UPI003B5B91DE